MSRAVIERHKRRFQYEARRNGWIDFQTDRLVPAFAKWWRSIQDLPYHQIKREWAASPFSSTNPNGPDEVQREVEEKQDQLLAVFAEYAGRVTDGPTERKKLLKEIRDKLLQVTSNQVVVTNLLLEYENSSD